MDKKDKCEREAVKTLADMVEEIEDKIEEAERFADKHELGFGLYTSYGMGGHYEEGEWTSSSANC